jgi:hypothetical protein
VCRALLSVRVVRRYGQSHSQRITNAAPAGDAVKGGWAMKKSIIGMSAVAAIVIAMGCSADEKKKSRAEQLSAIDPMSWSCRPGDVDDEDKCKPFTTQGSIPARLDHIDKLIHVAADERFVIIDGYEFVPKSTQWLAPFAKLRLKWKAHDHLMPFGGCNVYESKPEALHDEDEYSHFVSEKGLEIHVLKDELTEPEPHFLRIYPMQVPNGYGQRRFCIDISDRSGHIHNGAVHGEDH